MNRNILISKKEELEYELSELNKHKYLTPDEEIRIQTIKKMKLRIKDILEHDKNIIRF
jgi:hypothetical protein